jgi:hypothetical protein
VKSLLACLALFLSAASGAYAAPIFSATVEIPGTFQLDFETGTLPGDGNPSADVFWNQLTETTRQLARGLTVNGGSATPNDAVLFSLGVIGSPGYDAITEADLFGYAYSSAPIPGPPGGPLEVGGVFAVRTVEGNYAKAIVERFDRGDAGRDFYDIWIRYDLFAPQAVPEPSTYVLMLAGLLGLGWIARRRAS